jgi:hypothetical protein
LTEEEVHEVVHVAMTVGASRLKVLADAELTAQPLTPAPPTSTQGQEAPPVAEAPPVTAAPVTKPAGASFAAAPVVPAEGGG